MVNDEGVDQLAFAHNDYKCDVEICAAKGTLTCRVLTAPAGLFTCTIKKNQEYETRNYPLMMLS